MKRPRPGARHRWPAAVWCGFSAYGLALILATIHLPLATVPLSLFVLLCLAAPFIPHFGFFLPVVSRGRTGSRAVALTFDDGPDPETTLPLLERLARHRVTATFFVTGRRAASHPELIAAILKQGHAVANHSYTHGSLVMLARDRVLSGEVAATQRVLARHGVVPLAFRPPVGITHPGLGRVLDRLGLYAVNFSCRALDLGNRRVSRISRSILGRVRPDDIILLHDSRPGNGQTVNRWLREVERVLEGLENRGLAVVALERLINRPVMRTGLQPGGG